MLVHALGKTNYLAHMPCSLIANAVSAFIVRICTIVVNEKALRRLRFAVNWKVMAR